MTSAPPWDLYRSFLAVLQEGSLSGAARSLGLRQPTLGRHIDALEAALGIVLFTRSQEGVSATEAARELRPYAENMAALADALMRTASAPADAVHGSVRVTMSEVVGAEVLPPIITGLREAHPGLSIELVLSNRAEDLLRREADLAIRMFRPEQGALLARRVGDIVLGLHAHRRYLDRHGIPKSLADLPGHTLIGFDKESAFIRSLTDRGLTLKRTMFALRTDSDLAQLAAIRSGYGIGVCQVRLAQRDSDIVRLLPKTFAFPLDTWVVMHENLRNARRYRVVFDALVAGLAEYIRPEKITP